MNKLLLPLAALWLGVGAVACSGGGTADETCETACDVPPEAFCVGDSFVSYTAAGECVDGDCRYEAVTVECGAGLCGASGCASGPCEGVVCDAPPAGGCEGDTAVSYAAAGTCADGACDYAATRVDCAATDQICEDGACVAPRPPCEGVVCDEPPADGCEGDVALTYGALGLCDDATGDCGYTPSRLDCGLTDQTCGAGACVDRTSLCAGVVCDAPPAASCDEAGNRVSYGPGGTCDEADGSCTYAPITEPCTGEATCIRGACVEPTDPCASVNCTVLPPPECSVGGDVLTYTAGECVSDGGTARCVFSSTPTDCVDGAETCVSASCVSVPLPGQLVITEVLYDPAGDDTDAEWFEVHNTSALDLYLGGLTVTDLGGEVFVVDEEFIAAGEYLVFSAAASAVPGTSIVYSGIRLTNTTDALILSFAGVEVDRVAWDETDGWTDAVGASIALDPDASDNSVADAWCTGTAAYGPTASLGTPGEANPACVFACSGVVCDAPAPTCEGDVALTYSGSGTCVSTDGTCDFDPVEVREDCALTALECLDGACVTPAQVVAPGDLVITEIFADATGADGGLEWFEVANTTGAEIDLAGLVISDDGGEDFTVASGAVAAGQRVVFSGEPGATPGVEIDFAASRFTLGNTADEINLTYRDVLIDRVAWDTAAGWDVPTGASLSFGLDPVADENNVAGAWCAATTAYQAGALGTPGAANDVCATVEPFVPALLAPGDLVVTEIMANPNGIGDAEGEWIELYNATASPIDLRGLLLTGSTASEVEEIGEGVFVNGRSPEIGPGEYFVMAQAFTALGEVAELDSRVDYVFGTGFSLTNASDRVAIEDADGVVDAVAYSDAAVPPFPTGAGGASQQLSSVLMSHVLNDSGDSWCAGTTEYGVLVGVSNLGTPGAANETCGL